MTSLSPITGEWVQHHALKSRAVYEVVDVGGQLVMVEVISAPGLVMGTRVRLLRSVVAKMVRLLDRDSPER